MGRSIKSIAKMDGAIEMVFAFFFFLGVLLAAILGFVFYGETVIKSKEPIEPTIKVETINGVSDTTYYYQNQ